MTRCSVVMLGTDPSAFKVGSPLRGRLRAYAAGVDRLTAVIVGGIGDDVTEGNLRIVGSGGSRITRYREAYRVASSLRDYDLITVQDPFEIGLIGLRLARRSGARLHVQCHTDPFAREFASSSIFNRIRSWIAPRVLRRADAVRVVSRRAARSVAPYCAVPPTMIPIAVQLLDTEPVERGGAGRSRRGPVIVTVSRLEGEKDLPTVIRAFALVHGSIPGATLRIVGDGSMRPRLVALTRSLGLGDSVTFLGQVGDVPARLAEADVFVQASLFEGYGLSLLEAARAGLPIVTTDVGLVGDVLVDGRDCVTFTKGDHTACAEALLHVIRDVSAGQRLSRNARVAALATCRTIEAAAAEIVGDWRVALAPRSPRRLMVLTQAMDRDNPALGFFVRWVEAIAADADAVTVVCLERRGDLSSLPANVTVLSLGKDEGKGRFTYVARLFQYAVTRRGTYDSVFVHMNQEYVLLCGPLWRILGKRVSMWRNHTAGTWLTRCAGRIAHRCFYTSGSSYTATFPNAVKMPVGIDVEAIAFAPARRSDVYRVLMLGRIASSKSVLEGVRAVGALRERGLPIRLDVYGSWLPEDEEYVRQCRDAADPTWATFHGPVSHSRVGEVVSAHDVIVNASVPGMFDKTIFEAMAGGTAVVATNPHLRTVLPSGQWCAARTAPKIAESLLAAYSRDLDEDLEERARLALWVEEEHSLALLARRLVEYI